MVLQGELNRMHEWAVKWQMDFNINKCNTLHISKHNTGNKYTLSGVDIGKSNSERDLGVLVSQDLRPREQCISAGNRANMVLGFITRSVSNRSADVILRLYLALVRPHLDYAVQFWSLYYRMDIDKLEAVQRRMTKMIQGIRNLFHKDILKYLNLHCLERRKVKGRSDRSV